MLALVQTPQAVSIKIGARDMARWLYDCERLKESANGTLIGFTGFVPELMVRLIHTALDGDLPTARDAQRMVAPLARIIHNLGEPGCGAHQRMKVVRWLLGKFPSSHFRRPIRPLSTTQADRIRDQLQAIGQQCVR
ncbi:MAG: hypothetical protein M2R45_04683 [Verrucomicrobia subdivision 3 bacterium]|nr:hypothetical protein [Limisphaerales bacterium]MCS1416606.1 hypothetical protein [Limisphaerales bacterium]